MNDKLKEEKIKIINKNLKLGIIVLGILSIVMLISSKSYALFTRTIKTDNNVISITTKPKEGLGKDLLQYDIDIKKEVCNPIIEEDGITYLSGDNNCIDFNYVWYSGKLWRITAIYPDGSMKMVTQDNITTIAWGTSQTYKDSWIYQFLNEDFKDTLYNYQNIIVQNADWNVTIDENEIPEKPSLNAATVDGDVGLLSVYEYYQSYKNIGNDIASKRKSYLNKFYHSWFITPTSDSNVRVIYSNSNFDNVKPSSSDVSVRPVINIKAGIELSGVGSKKNPYIIKGDIETGKSGESINTRISGEYVKIDNKVYRIVGTEDNKTKLTSVDYVRDKNNDVVMKKIFESNTNWQASVASGSDDYWGYYLNNTWLTENLKQYLTEGTYYLGIVNYASYKNALCSTNNTTETTKKCEKISSTWSGLVGLPIMGEMFSAQLGEGSQSSSDIWLMTSNSVGVAWWINQHGYLACNSPPPDVLAVRPSIYLKPEVKITGGEGTEDKPYEIGL